MDKKFYLEMRKELSLKPKLSALLIYWLQDICLITLTAGLWNIFSDSWVKLCCIPLLSILMFRNFSMMHDAVHLAVSKNKRLNDLAGYISGAICFLPFEPWKKSHLEHHLWSGNIDRDPVTYLVTNLPKMSAFKQNGISFAWQNWIPVMGLAQYLVFWKLMTKTWMQNPRSVRVNLSFTLPLIMLGGILALSSLAFIGTLAASVVLYLIFVEAVNFPHHLRLPQLRGDTKLAAWDQHAVSRSCIYPKWFSSLVVLNFNYHTEHHLFPDAPWYYLPQIHQKVSANLGDSYNTDNNFGWIFENRKLTIKELLQPQNPYQATKSDAPPAAEVA